MAGQIRKRTVLLHGRNKHCHWCGKVTRLSPKGVSAHGADVATLDHLDDKYSPERGQHPDKVRTVLACEDCNTRRGKERTEQVMRELQTQLSALLDGLKVATDTLEQLQRGQGFEAMVAESALTDIRRIAPPSAIKVKVHGKSWKLAA